MPRWMVKIIVKDHIHIGMATALPSGNLIVSSEGCRYKDLVQLAQTTNALAEKAQEEAHGRRGRKQHLYH